MREEVDPALFGFRAACAEAERWILEGTPAPVLAEQALVRGGSPPDGVRLTNRIAREERAAVAARALMEAIGNRNLAERLRDVTGLVAYAVEVSLVGVDAAGRAPQEMIRRDAERIRRLLDAEAPRVARAVPAEEGGVKIDLAGYDPIGGR